MAEGMWEENMAVELDPLLPGKGLIDVKLERLTATGDGLAVAERLAAGDIDVKVESACMYPLLSSV